MATQTSPEDLEWIKVFVASPSAMVNHLQQMALGDEHPLMASLLQALQASWSALSKLPLNSETSVGSDLSETKLWAQIALDFTWEQLNTGHWKDVKHVWKEAYSTASLMKAMCLVLEGQKDKALVEIDKGLLLGAPIMDNTLQTFATVLTKAVVSTKKCQDNRSTVCSDAPGSPVAHASSSSMLNPQASTSSKKVVFRNYKPIHSTDKLTLLHNVGAQSLPSKYSVFDTPLIDPSLRVPVRHCPSLEEFLQEHMKTRTPVVISGAMDHWPAYAAKKWRYSV